MFLIAGQEEDYEAGVSAVFLTPLTPLRISPSLSSLSLHSTSDQAQCSLPDLGLWPKGPFSPTLPFSSLQGIVWNLQGTLFRAMSGCWVTEQLPFLILRVGNEQSDSLRLYFAPHVSCCDHCLGALTGASPQQLQCGSSKYSWLKS